MPLLQCTQSRTCIPRRCCIFGRRSHCQHSILFGIYSSLQYSADLLDPCNHHGCGIRCTFHTNRKVLSDFDNRHHFRIPHNSCQHRLVRLRIKCRRNRHCRGIRGKIGQRIFGTGLIHRNPHPTGSFEYKPLGEGTERYQSKGGATSFWVLMLLLCTICLRSVVLILLLAFL